MIENLLKLLLTLWKFAFCTQKSDVETEENVCDFLQTLKHSQLHKTLLEPNVPLIRRQHGWSMLKKNKQKKLIWYSNSEEKKSVKCSIFLVYRLSMRFFSIYFFVYHLFFSVTWCIFKSHV